MKHIIQWNGHPVEVDTNDRMILLPEQGQDAALLYMPGLPCHIMINLSGPHPVWGWNGSKENPTFSPSILTRLPWGIEQKEIVNHVFIREGRIQYLSDCTHEHAGKTIDLPKLCDWPRDFILWDEPFEFDVKAFNDLFS